MNLRFALKLMTLPTAIGALLALAFLTQRASAADSRYVAVPVTDQSCELPVDQNLKSSLRHLRQGFTVASAGGLPGETVDAAFSAAESDAAAVLFGCDCSNCIKALRQLRSQPLLAPGNSRGHCLTSLERRVSPQRMQEVLQELELREAETR